MKYTEVFEKYWEKTNPNFRNLEQWQWEELKRVAFRSWLAGRKYEKNIHLQILKDYVNVSDN